MASGYFQRLRNEGRNFYQSLTRSQRWLIGGASAAVVISLLVVGVWLQQPQWSTLFAHLDSKDAAQIVEQLKEENIPYQLQNQAGGTLIQVPAAQVHDLRLQMAAQDLPREGGVFGFELFDQDNMGLTNRSFDLNYQRALAGELSRTIMQLEAVERARVHLAIPRKQIFTDMQDPPTASVTLKLKPLASLGEEQVKGISKLVAGSVPGLEQKNVTITDASGNVLFDAEMAEGTQSQARLNRQQLELQQANEQEIRQNVERILSRVVGSGRVNVQVKAQMNFDREESVSKSFTPNEGGPADDTVRALRSEKEVSESGQGTEPIPGGVPGAATNIPGYREQVAENDARYQRSDVTRNYEVPETQTTRVRNPGTVDRLTLSVAVDSQSPAINAPEGLDVNDPLVQNLRNLAVAAAGLDLRRGDTIAIYALPFENSGQLREQQALEQAEQMDFWTKAILMGLLGLVLILLVLALLTTWLRARRRAVEAESLDDAFLPPDDEIPVLQPPQDPELTEAVVKRAQAVNSLTEMAKSDPAQVARLLRVWMQES